MRRDLRSHPRFLRPPGRNAREAVTRHVDQDEAPSGGVGTELEEIELLGTARQLGGARERLLSGQRVQQAGLADIRAPREGDFRRPARGQVVGALRGVEELAGRGEEKAPGLERLVAQARCSFAVWRMITHCWATDRMLFQAQ